MAKNRRRATFGSRSRKKSITTSHDDEEKTTLPVVIKKNSIKSSSQRQPTQQPLPQDDSEDDTNVASSRSLVETSISSTNTSTNGVGNYRNGPNTDMAMTLSYNNVDFRLTPSTESAYQRMNLSNVSSQGIRVELSNFTGTLLVSHSSFIPISRAITPSVKSENMSLEQSLVTPAHTAVGFEVTNKQTNAQSRKAKRRKLSNSRAEKDANVNDEDDEDEDDMPLSSALKSSKNARSPKKSKPSDDITPQKRNRNKSKSDKDDDEKVVVPTLHQHTLSSTGLTLTPSNSNDDSDDNSSSSHHSQEDAITATQAKIRQNCADEEPHDRRTSDQTDQGSTNEVDPDMPTEADFCELEVVDESSNLSFKPGLGHDTHTSMTLDEHDSLPLPSKATDTPVGRWGHTQTLINKDRVIIYGGQHLKPNSTASDVDFHTLSDVYVYHTRTQKWSKPFNCDSIARCWHTSTFLPHRNLLIVLGGESTNTKQTKITDKVMVLDTDIMLWYPPSVTGSVPGPRSGSSASLLDGNELVLFGGISKANRWLNSVAVLDTRIWKWNNSVRVSGDVPKARSYHSATVFGTNATTTSTAQITSTSKRNDRLLIFGGNDDDECFDTCHVLDYVLDETTKTLKWNWFHPQTTGDAPAPRTGHSATLLPDGTTILIYGGWDPCTDDSDDDDDDKDDSKESKTVIYSDSFLLDTETWVWRKGPTPVLVQENTKNVGPQRVGHGAVLASLETTTTSNKDKSSGSGSGSACEVLVFGGRAPNGVFGNDVQRLVIDTLEPDTNGKPTKR